MKTGTIKRLYAYFSKKLGAYNYRRGWLKSDCPSCNEHKFGINLFENRTHCFRCGFSPRPLDLVSALEKVNDPYKVLINIQDLKSLPEPKVEQLEHKEHILPKEYRSLLVGSSNTAKMARRYLQNRGFDINKLAMKAWGYCASGNYAHRIIMPIIENGEIIYFHARSFVNATPKFKNPTFEEVGIGKSLMMYNVDALQIYDWVFVVESIMNAETLGDRAIAIGGKAISKYQVSTFLSRNTVTQKFIIILDPDALSEAIATAIELIRNGKEVKIIQLPESKDVNDLGLNKTYHYILQAKSLTINQALLWKQRVN